MIASALIYLGALLAIPGLIAVVIPLRRSRRWRMSALLVALTGIALVLAGVGLPSRDVVVVIPRERLDSIMPRYQFNERHTVAVAATPLEVNSAIRAVTPDEIRFYHTLTWIRRLGRRGSASLLDAPRGEPILALATRTGFHLLVDEPGREVVLGAAGPVSPAARAEVSAGARRAFVASADGYASVAMNFRVTPDGRGGSLLSTETRMFAPDPQTRRRLATYWRVIYPGSALIRRGWLNAIRKRAEESSREP